MGNICLLCPWAFEPDPRFVVVAQDEAPALLMGRRHIRQRSPHDIIDNMPPDELLLLLLRSMGPSANNVHQGVVVVLADEAEANPPILEPAANEESVEVLGDEDSLRLLLLRSMGQEAVLLADNPVESAAHQEPVVAHDPAVVVELRQAIAGLNQGIADFETAIEREQAFLDHNQANVDRSEEAMLHFAASIIEFREIYDELSDPASTLPVVTTMDFLEQAVDDFREVMEELGEVAYVHLDPSSVESFIQASYDLLDAPVDDLDKPRDLIPASIAELLEQEAQDLLYPAEDDESSEEFDHASFVGVIEQANGDRLYFDGSDRYYYSFD
jgi:hypothetical protein